MHQNVSYQKVRVSPALLAFDMARPSMGITVAIAFTSERFQLAPIPIYCMSKEKKKELHGQKLKEQVGTNTHRQRQERATVEQILTGRGRSEQQLNKYSQAQAGASNS